jgi:hypothetical protein
LNLPFIFKTLRLFIIEMLHQSSPLHVDLYLPSHIYIYLFQSLPLLAGHHAESNTSMGFCFFNNAAVAARAAQAAGARRVIVLDWDVVRVEPLDP